MNYVANIKNLLALCHIIDEFPKFQEKLEDAIELKDNRKFLDNVRKISIGKYVMGHSKAKKFYNENKNVIDTINKYSNIYFFVAMNYTSSGLPFFDNSLDYFYEYLLKHKNEMSKIIKVLEQLKKLGYEEFEFNEEVDFTKETYTLHDSPYRAFLRFSYLDNMEIIPNYLPSETKYKTTGSNYNIQLELSHSNHSTIYDDIIILNNLVFDADRLPKEISKNETYDKILSLKNEKKQEYSLIQESVDLNVSINDLYLEFENTKQKISTLNNIKEKDELIKYLSNIKEMILKMQEINNNYNKEIASSNEPITEELINEEVKSYQLRRKNSKIHTW